MSATAEPQDPTPPVVADGDQRWRAVAWSLYAFDFGVDVAGDAEMQAIAEAFCGLEARRMLVAHDAMKAVEA